MASTPTTTTPISSSNASAQRSRKAWRGSGRAGSTGATGGSCRWMAAHMSGGGVLP
ncbi:hypothetical protein [Hymenobacter sp. APR13]|uniref:hypothetical protein n=1 Tax=Hymenobacter sp. APR13 TaxID=1356852 RepID=UPI0004E098C6|nr:hypothetical protein [Hymenobacter sp. APR13]AII50585.1 hypothetical protein N008_01125 [Hymenobacter sp. APR13]